MARPGLWLFGPGYTKRACRGESGGNRKTTAPAEDRSMLQDTAPGAAPVTLPPLLVEPMVARDHVHTQAHKLHLA